MPVPFYNKSQWPRRPPGISINTYPPIARPIISLNICVIKSHERKTHLCRETTKKGGWGVEGGKTTNPDDFAYRSSFIHIYTPAEKSDFRTRNLFPRQKKKKVDKTKKKSNILFRQFVPISKQTISLSSPSPPPPPTTTKTPRPANLVKHSVNGRTSKLR